MWRPPSDFWADIIAIIAVLVVVALTMGGMWVNLVLSRGRNP